MAVFPRIDSPGDFSVAWTFSVNGPATRVGTPNCPILLFRYILGFGALVSGPHAELAPRQTGRGMRSMRPSSGGCIRHAISDVSVSKSMTQGGVKQRSLERTLRVLV